jgi:hypothetical protein
MFADDTLLWIATALPLGILIGIAATQALGVIIRNRRQSRLDAGEDDPPPRRRDQAVGGPTR